MSFIVKLWYSVNLSGGETLARQLPGILPLNLRAFFYSVDSTDWLFPLFLHITPSLSLAPPSPFSLSLRPPSFDLPLDDGQVSVCLLCMFVCMLLCMSISSFYLSIYNCSVVCMQSPVCQTSRKCILIVFKHNDTISVLFKIVFNTGLTHTSNYDVMRARGYPSSYANRIPICLPL